MFVEIVLNTVLFPLGFGMILYTAAVFFSKQKLLVTFITGILMLCIYILLEGIPSIPPVSSKHKVALIIFGFAIIAVITGNLSRAYFGISSILLIAALVWLGWNQLFDPSILPRFLALIVPVILASFAFVKFDWQQENNLDWPITLLSFAIGGSIISLLGAYIGFAQTLGAMAAFVGGYILLTYIWMILRPDSMQAMLPKAANQIILLGLVTLLFVVGLFAPDVSPLALAILGTTFLVPVFHPHFNGSNRLLKPILIGLIAAIPTAASIAIAAL